MEMLWNKWCPWAWPFMLFGYRFALPDSFPEVPDDRYRLTIGPRAGHNAKEVVKQMCKVFNDKMDVPSHFDGTSREYLAALVADYFDMVNGVDGYVDMYDINEWCASNFTFELIINKDEGVDERAEALKQLKGCNALRIVVDEVVELQKDAETRARWRTRQQYFSDVAERLNVMSELKEGEEYVQL